MPAPPALTGRAAAAVSWLPGLLACLLRTTTRHDMCRGIPQRTQFNRFRRLKNDRNYRVNHFCLLCSCQIHFILQFSVAMQSACVHCSAARAPCAQRRPSPRIRIPAIRSIRKLCRPSLIARSQGDDAPPPNQGPTAQQLSDIDDLINMLLACKNQEDVRHGFLQSHSISPTTLFSFDPALLPNCAPVPPGVGPRSSPLHK